MSDHEIMGHISQEHIEDIKVCLRLRPLNARERNPKFWKPTAHERAWKVLPQHRAIVQLQQNGRPVTGDDRKVGRTMFVYDQIFDENDTTEYVYDFVGKGIVQSVVEGRNGSVFAYGQTGSGKTHTMQGTGGIREGMLGGKEKPGVVHLVARDLFQEAGLVKDRDFTFSVSVIEVYNEEVRDLLSKDRDNRLTIREDASRGVFVNAVRVEANSLKKMLSCLSVGEKNRVVARTTLNKRSSRSHIIFSINVESFPTDGVDRTSNRFGQISTLNLVDLAGSESVRHRSAHSTERRRKEGGSINKSLLTLSLVIQALGLSARRTSIANSHSHVNYRDSKLTRVLQPSLSGNARLAFICCATLSAMYTEETKSTLQFASRIKHVKTKSRVNLMEEEDDSSTASHLREELMEMKREMAEINQRLKELDAKNQKLRTSLEEITKERDEALEKIVNLEKEKTAAVIATADAVAVAARTTRERSGRKEKVSILPDRPPIVAQSTQKTRDAETKDKKQFGQIGYLTSMVDRLVNNERKESIEHQKRFEVPQLEDKLEPISMAHGLRGNIRVGSSRTNVSDITSATRYGSYRSYDDGQDATQLPMLGLESTSPKHSYCDQSGEGISGMITDLNETSGEMPSGLDTSVSSSEHEEEYDDEHPIDAEAEVLEYSA